MGLLDFLNDLKNRWAFHFELYYSKNMDWHLQIWKQGYGENNADNYIVDCQSCDLSYVLAKGESELKEWLLENEGGY